MSDLTFKSNPGPNKDSTYRRYCSGRFASTTTRRPKQAPACFLCSKTVWRNQKRLVFEICKDFSHAVCTQMSVAYMKNIRSDSPISWNCPKCSLFELPFYDQHLDQSSDTSDLSIHDDDEHFNVLRENSNHLKIMHINTQSMTSTFDSLFIHCKSLFV